MMFNPDQGRWVRHGDVDDDFLAAAVAAGEVAWDIETSGLDWRLDRIATCQLATRTDAVVVQVGPWGAPERLRSLLADVGVRKVFHHAPSSHRRS